MRVLTENASTSDLEEGNDKRIALQTLPKIDTDRVCVDWVDRPQNYKALSRAIIMALGFVWNFTTFAKFPFEQFSAENS